MFKGFVSFSIVSLMFLIAILFYASNQAKKIDAVLIEAKNTYPEIDDYIGVVEMLYFKALQNAYDEAIIKLVHELPPSVGSYVQSLKRFNVKQAALSFEKGLDRLTHKVTLINPSVATLPSRSWIYLYSRRSKLTAQEIPLSTMQAIYDLAQKTEPYSIEGLKKVFEYRNLAVFGCSQYFPASAFTDINEPKECSQIQSTLMEKDWQRWFSASGEAKHFLPRLKQSFAELATIKHASLEVCGLTPYKTQYVIEHTAEDGPVQVQGWYHLEVGECRTHEKQFINTEPAFWVHVSTPDQHRFTKITEQIRTTLLNDANLDNDRFSHDVVADHRDTTQCLANERLSFTAPVSEHGACPAERPRDAGFTMAMADKRRENWHFFAEHKYLTPFFDPLKLASDADVKKSALEYVKSLDQVINHQEAFEATEWKDSPPFSLGARIVDYNGPFNQGVRLYDVPIRSIDDVPLPYQEGDILVALNGDVVWGASDLHRLLMKHGSSLSGGYDVPLTVVLKRGNELLQHRVSYFFGKSHPAFSQASEGKAFYFGALDFPSLGASAGATCAGINGLKIVANTLAFTANFLNELTKNHSSKQLPYVALEDMTKCRWQANQMKAIVKQRHKELYTAASLVGLVLPSPLRVILLEENAGLGLAGGWFGRGALKEARLLGLEMGLWSLGSSAPELPFQTRIDHAERTSMIGAGLGFVVAVLSGK